MYYSWCSSLQAYYKVGLLSSLFYSQESKTTKNPRKGKLRNSAEVTQLGSEANPGCVTNSLKGTMINHLLLRGQAWQEKNKILRCPLVRTNATLRSKANGCRGQTKKRNFTIVSAWLQQPKKLHIILSHAVGTQHRGIYSSEGVLSCHWPLPTASLSKKGACQILEQSCWQFQLSVGRKRVEETVKGGDRVNLF